MDELLGRWCARVGDAAAAGTALCIRGAGSKEFYGGPLRGEVFDTREYAGIVNYEPTELVVTARCGTPLAELEAVLAGRGQFLACEPALAGGSFGGAVAAGLSGPRRQQAGALRDFVLGVRVIDGRGELLHFGGEVMKNVAGYDVARLFAGSLGTLGIIVEASLKVLPQPQTETSLAFEAPQGRAIELMNRWGGRPLPVSATCWHDDVLAVRLSGAPSAVAAAAAQLGGEALADAAGFWSSLRAQTHPFFADRPLWRFSVPSDAAPLPLPAAQLIEWGGAQRWCACAADAGHLRELAAAAGGHATLFRGASEDQRAAGVFQPLAPPLLAIHRRLKAGFDPQGIFNRQRLYPGL